MRRVALKHAKKFKKPGKQESIFIHFNKKNKKHGEMYS